MAIITIHDLRVVRRGTEILTGIQWDVSAKENWVILGANGSGKTTLLSCVTGYVTPSAGTIEVLGKQYGKADWRELRKEVGLVSSGIRHWIEDQQTALDVVASGRNAELNLWHPAEGTLRRDARKCLRQVECASSRRSALGISLPGRTTTSVNWSSPDGKVSPLDSRRAVRRS